MHVKRLERNRFYPYCSIALLFSQPVGSVGTYLVKHLHCSVLVAQTEISDDQFAKLTVTAAQA